MTKRRQDKSRGQINVSRSNEAKPQKEPNKADTFKRLQTGPKWKLSQRRPIFENGLRVGYEEIVDGIKVKVVKHDPIDDKKEERRLLQAVTQEFIECAKANNTWRGSVIFMVNTQRGFDINAKGWPVGITALHAAAAYGAEDFVDYLIEKKECDPTVVDNFGRTASDIAREARQPESLQKKLIDFECSYVLKRKFVL